MTAEVSGVMEVECVIHRTHGAYGGLLGAEIQTPAGLSLVAQAYSQMDGSDGVSRSMRAKAVFSGVVKGQRYHLAVRRTDGSFANMPSFSWFVEIRSS